MKKLIIVCTIIMTSLSLYSQDPEKKEQHSYVGLGIRASVFQISELPNYVMPPNRLLLNIDPIKNLRFEGHFAYFKTSSEIPVSIYPTGTRNMTLTQKSALFGGGVFGLIPVDKVKFIIGMRYSSNHYSDDNILYNSSGTPYVASDEGKINALSGVIGGEYHFAKWFSIGAEFSYMRLKDVLSPASSTTPDLTTKTSITESALIFRFYPY
jgi:hypothetical protein